MTLRVLLVEDDADLRATLRAALQVDGHDVFTAASLAEGLALLTHAGAGERGFDVVLLDLALPDGDGEKLLALLRRSRNWPVLVISARDAIDAKIRLLDAGADDYLIKPFSVAELLARMRVAVRHRGTSVQPAVTRYARQGVEIDLSAQHVQDTHYLRLYMAQLRAKLEADPADPQLLLTEPGVGYRLTAADDASS